MTTKRKRKPNTVQGTRRGQAWPEEVRIAAMCDLLVDSDLARVARRHGVPESTLRTWLTAARKRGRAGLFEEARREALRTVGQEAAQASVLSLRYMRARLEKNEADAALHAELGARLDELDAAPGGSMDAERRSIAARMERHQPMSDFAAANYARTLVGITGRAAVLLGEEKPEDRALEVTVEVLG